MHLTLTRAVILIAALGVGSRAVADIATYGDAIRSSLESNPALSRAYFEFAASRERINVVNGERLPTVDLTAVEGREQRTTPLTDFGRYDVSEMRFSVTQLLFDGYETKDRVRTAEYEARRDYRAYEAAKLSTALDATQAYIEVAVRQRLVDYAEQNYFLHRRVTTRISERVNSGRSPRVDLEQVKARLALAESNVLTEAANLHDTIAELQRIANDVIGTDRLPMPMISDELIPKGLSKLLDETYRNSPRVWTATEQLRALSADRDAARGPFFPRIDLRYRFDQSTNLQGLRGEFETEALELLFNFNFYRGGSDVAQRRERNQRYFAAIEARKQACVDTRREVLIAQNDIVVLEQQVDLLSQQQIAQREARIAYEDEFDKGDRSLLDLLDSQNELFDTQRALVRAEANLIGARARLLAEGGLLLEAIGADVKHPVEGNWKLEAFKAAPYDPCPDQTTIPVADDFDFEAVYERMRGRLNDAAAP